MNLLLDNSSARLPGFPMVAPTASLLAAWHRDHAVIQHRCPGNHAWHSGQEATDDGPNTNNVSMLAKWLSLIDLYRWPHLYFLKRNEDLSRLLASVPHPSRRRRAQWDYIRAQATESAPRVAEALRRAANYVNHAHS